MKTTQIFILILALLFSSKWALGQKGIVMAQKDRIWTYVDLDGNPIREGEKRWRIYPFDPKGVGLVNMKGFKLIDAKGAWVETEVESFDADVGLFGGGTNFSDGWLKVAVDKKWGQMNHLGQLVIAPQYDDITAFRDGFAIANQGDRFVVVDSQGNETLIERQDIEAYKAFYEGLAHIRTADALWGFVATSGKVAITPTFLSVGDFHGGLAWAKTTDDLVGFIGHDGNWIIAPQFQAVKDFDPVCGLAMVKVNDVWQHVDRDGNLRQFNASDKPYSFSDGLAIGRLDDKVGFIDANGNWAIEAQFKTVRDFKNGFAAVEKDDKWGLIDKQGKWILEPVFDNLKDVVLLD